MNKTMADQLREPFLDAQVGKLPKVNCADCSNKDKTCSKHQRKTCRVCKAYISTQHIHIDYVGHAHVTERLLNVDPNWNWEPLALDNQGLPAMDQNGGLWIRLKVGETVRLGYGHSGAKRGGDAVKEVIGDAIRNAAMRFGVALDLWKKETPDAVAEPAKPKAEEASLTPAQRAGQLRALIAQMGKQEDKTIDDIAAEFHEWSGKKYEINTAGVPVLAEYLEHLKVKAS